MIFIFVGIFFLGFIVGGTTVFMLIIRNFK